jgi:hypothetical protein
LRPTQTIFEGSTGASNLASRIGSEASSRDHFSQGGAEIPWMISPSIRP